ncbi:MAG TPA: hypothetical protein VFO65_05310 [Acidimicrobiales bacterium]|nr:hypothetical protein [Acidimicrobiales bacterium]
MTTAQVVFSIALGTIAVGIMAFGLYVASSTLWGDRWVRGRKRP